MKKGTKTRPPLRVVRSYSDAQTEVEQEIRGEHLRDAIKRSGMNHTDFARLIEVDVRTIRRWLEGTRKIDGPTGVLLFLLSSYPKDTLANLDADSIKGGSYH